MKIKPILSTNPFIILLVALLTMLTACATFEVGIEPLTTTTSSPEISQINHDSTPTETVFPPSDIRPTKTLSPPPVISGLPDLVSIGYLIPFANMEIGVLTIKDGQLKVDPSPVNYGIFWDYSPQSGGLAYSSEFFHPTVSNNLGVSDLWVYDYQTGTDEKWLEDNVTRATWAPDGEHLTAAVYNPESEQINLVLVSGPDQVEIISECASDLFSWSPAGDMLAYVNALTWLNFGVDETCLGTYLVSFPSGISREQRDISRVSDFGTQKFSGTHFLDQPLWALEQNALVYPDSPFWIVPLDGSPAFIPQTPGDQDPMNMPRPYGNLWSQQLNQLIGNVESGPGGGFGGVWVYQLSQDLHQIEDYYRIGDVPQGENSFIELIDWWVPGESILILDGDKIDPSQYLSEVWREPAVWTLLDKRWSGVP
jgi:hypothetical protein